MRLGHRGGVESSGPKVAQDYCVTDVWAVLPDRIVERATIVVEDGLIVSVVGNGATKHPEVHGHGAVCIPGLVDLHDDVRTDPTPTEHAVTTHLHVHRFPVDDLATGAAAVTSGGATVLVSVPASALTAAAGDAEPALEWLTVQAMAQRLRLLVRGPVTADDVDRAVDLGAGAVEYPATIEAARRAHERGLAVIGSAADIVASSEAPTAISPLALIELGLCDALSSAARPTSLLDAVSLLVLRGVCDLRGAVGLVTSAPAGIAGLSDRGRLTSSQRGDLVLLRPDHEHFRVRAVLRAGDAAVITEHLVG
jgi:alpha-D-ribose 1-methylphosphonate 5-triphosphate diphosphatase PhnM